MGKRKNSTTTIMIMLFLLVFSLPALALSRENERRETLRINAMELKEVDITSTEKPKQITIVLDERSVHATNDSTPNANIANFFILFLSFLVIYFSF